MLKKFFIVNVLFIRAFVYAVLWVSIFWIIGQFCIGVDSFIRSLQNNSAESYRMLNPWFMAFLVFGVLYIGTAGTFIPEDASNISFKERLAGEFFLAPILWGLLVLFGIPFFWVTGMIDWEQSIVLFVILLIIVDIPAQLILTTYIEREFFAGKLIS